MIALTALGSIGAFAIEPYVGVAVYYLFAVLRPQYLWEWALPPAVTWSSYVAWPTMFATLWLVLSPPLNSPKLRAVTFSRAHKAFLVFGAWICLTYVTAQNQNAAWPWFLEYIKLFIMFGLAAFVLRTLQQVRLIYLLTTIALIYIAYEVNYLYLVNGRLDIYRNGYGGLDNNGAGLMLAMVVPLAVHAWEGTRRWWRWIFVGSVPLVLHAVLMTYSRGAMLSLIAATPLLMLRSERKKQFGLVLILLIALVPTLAGNEIRTRFFSTQDYDSDESANSRFDSWRAAILIANDYPVFGAGIRNANLLSYQYGADMEGRTIHSQYFQTLADAGYPGLALYLFALGSTWLAMRRARRVLKSRADDDAQLARSMLSGVEGSLFVFCFGAAFLSLEVFELPYIVSLMGAQVSLLTMSSTAADPAKVLSANRSPQFAKRQAISLRPRVS